MACEFNFLPSLISAGSALTGVVLGGLITYWRENAKDTRRTQQNASYLAILVVAHLDHFVDGCLSVAFDDGTEHGQPAGSGGCWEFTVRPPVFEPLKLDVEWKSLPQDLMYGVLNLPHKTMILNEHVNGTWLNDDPPDYGKAFYARQHGFAKLGLEVSELIVKLRAHAKIPVMHTPPGERDRVTMLQEQLEALEAANATWEARRAIHTPP